MSARKRTRRTTTASLPPNVHPVEGLLLRVPHARYKRRVGEEHARVGDIGISLQDLGIAIDDTWERFNKRTDADGLRKAAARLRALSVQVNTFGTEALCLSERLLVLARFQLDSVDPLTDRDAEEDDS